MAGLAPMTRGAKNLTSGFTDEGSPTAPTTSVNLVGDQTDWAAAARAVRGLVPVQRLNARENAAGSENPTR